MGSLVSIIGNSGVGKTTLVKRLAERAGFFTATEDLEQRPFQALFAQDLMRYALANQIDFLVYRAEQERQIRSMQGIGIQDGGLDLDFQIFTRLFHQAGYLSAQEFDVCHRLYRHIRQTLSPPELTVYLNCPLEIISARYKARNRKREIAQPSDLQAIQSLLESWLQKIDPNQILTIDAGDEGIISIDGVDRIAQRIIDKLSP